VVRQSTGNAQRFRIRHDSNLVDNSIEPMDSAIRHADEFTIRLDTGTRRAGTPRIELDS
jgi:hypothetical protein